ncbi:alpha/beta fold hydrolase [Aureimonas sp. OT7]|uniref:alpha/beta fold hydrolase n=1 Tax=Aureimonas TaxID=414371 RepID=UPI001782ECAE|nr:MULTISPECIES: alpha/beta fold hydrolase [Aureimonas]QOG05275.1 alpha/beta fold hydrolase [Aureimonas sp. OT7]
MTNCKIADRPLLVLLHAFGSSRNAWNEIAPHFEEVFDVFAPDLPGFGSAADQGARSVEDTVTALAGEIADRVGPKGWIAAGHSMGGKFATILASGRTGGLSPARGVLLLAGSPPSPEPMGEDRRAEMIGWARDGRIDESEASAFVSANTGSPLPTEAARLAVADVMASSADAWTAWLETGSREDWSGRVGGLDMPCAILVGSEDGDLGEAGQRATNMTVYDDAELSVEAGCGHLLPLERPAAVVAALSALQRRADMAGAPIASDGSVGARSA